jgi:tetratricopeptide (TPR) repeat protein
MVHEQQSSLGSLTVGFPVRQVLAGKSFFKRAFGFADFSHGDTRVKGKKRVRVRGYPKHLVGDTHQQLYKGLFHWMLACTAVFLLLVAVLCATCHIYRPYEEKSLVAEAGRYLAAGDYSNAETTAGQALDLNPTELAACRIMADAATRGHLPSELYWVQRLADVAPTMENRLRLAETGLRCQTAPFPVTTMVLNELSSEASSNPLFHLMAGELALKLNKGGVAEAQFAAAVQLDPENHDSVLNLATLQLHSSNPAEQKQARQQLENLALDSTRGPAALRVLTADRNAAGDFQAASHYSDQLLALPQVTLADRLENLGILQRMNSTAFNDRLAMVMDLAATTPQTVTELSIWMQANGLASQNIDWLCSLPKNIRMEQSFKLSLLQAYEQSGKWQSAINWGIRDNWSRQDFLRLAMLSHAWAQLGVPTVAKSNWTEAVNQAGDSYEAVTNLMVLAKRWQMSDEQQDLSMRILQLAPQ